MNILIVDDQAKMRNLIKEYLKLEGFDYDEADNGETALEYLRRTEYDAVLLDVMMPIRDGWSVLKEIRKVSSIPVIMLTAKGEEYDKLYGFELGADDYLIKPFSPKELIARLKAILKRGKVFENENTYKIEGLEIDYNARLALVNKNSIKLTPKEYDLLVYLIQNKNIALNRQQILDGVWGIDFYGDDRTVDQHIKMLRESIKPYKDLIKTVWGIGYKFEERRDKYD
ncbi:MAG: response regulator transcription factor [Gudongella sp.]|nr:response regulator transcription factor [Gudongella sp.]